MRQTANRPIWRWAMATASVALALSLGLPTALADGLEAQKQAADQAVNQAQANVNDLAAKLQAAQTAVEAANADVVAAQEKLAAAEDAWNQAQALQAQRTVELYNANQALADAEAAVATGQATIDAQRDDINAYARAIVQDQSGLVQIALVLTASTTAQLADRMQWNDTVLAANQVDLDRLRQTQAGLVKAQLAADDAQQRATAAKQAADDQAVAAEAARQEAADAEAALEDALARSQAAQDAATQALNQAQTQLAQAKATQADLAAQIEAAARAAEAARQAAAAAAAQAAAAAANSGSTGSYGGGLSPSAAQAAARSMIGAYGWGDSQFQCLVWLWNQESGWRWNARNPSSGAYGIPQSLPATKMASAGPDWQTNAITQMRWGMNYIAGRYGTPCGAWSHERGYNWY